MVSADQIAFAALYGNYTWGELPDIREDTSGLIWAIMTFIFAILGLVTTPLLLRAITIDKKMRSQLSFQLVALICVGDFLMSILGCVVFGCVLFYGNTPSFMVCQITGTVYPWLALTLFTTYLVIAYDRWTLLCKSKTLPGKSAYNIIGCASVSFFCISSLAAVTNGAVGYNEIKLNGACFVGGGKGVPMHDFVLVIYDMYFAVVATLLVFFYASIYYHMKRVFGNSTTDREVLAKTQKTQQKIALQFSIITLFFISCWTILCILWVLSPFSVKIENKHIDGAIGFSCHLNSMANPIVYSVLNKKLREAILNVMPTPIATWLTNAANKTAIKSQSLRTSLKSNKKTAKATKEAAEAAARATSKIIPLEMSNSITEVAEGSNASFFEHKEDNK